MPTRVTFGKVMRDHGVSAYRLVKETEGVVARNTVFSLARGTNIKRIDLDSLEELMRALSAVIGRRVELAEVLSVELGEIPQPRRSAAGVPYTNDGETNEILDDVPDILERIKQPGVHRLEDVLAEIND